MKQYIGIALNDDYTQLCINHEEKLLQFPTGIAKLKDEDVWHIGEEAYRLVLDGKAAMVDQLLRLLRRRGTATLDGRCYTALELLSQYFACLLRGVEADSMVCISMRRAEKHLMEALESIMAGLQREKRQYLLISHTESFVHFVMQQDKRLYRTTTGMFELSNQCLYYYEMHAQRQGNEYMIIADSQSQEEAFDLELLRTEAGAKVADKLLRGVAERIIGRKSYSSVFLSGRGFADTGFAEEFMRFLCERRCVCIEAQLFAIGAAYAAGMACGELEMKEKYQLICDTRIHASVGLKLTIQEKESLMPLAVAGQPWFDSKTQLEAILDGQNYIDLAVTVPEQTKRRQLRIPLDGFPERENKTSRIGIRTHFDNARHLWITVSDLGFGELFPSSGQEIRELIEL